MRKPNIKNSISKKIVFIFGLVFVIAGAIFMILSFKNEILDDKYVIKEVTNYISKEPRRLSPGEIQVRKNIEYEKEGIYKIIYTNYAKKEKGTDLLESGTYFSITDSIGEGYELFDNKIIVNNKEYNLENGVSSKGINISYDDNTIFIDIPSSLITKKNIIEFNIKLVRRDLDIKYMTSKESYYGFTPSIDNNFYNKKVYQTYVIEGTGYIKLEKK